MNYTVNMYKASLPCSQMNRLYLWLGPQTQSVCSQTSSPLLGLTGVAWRGHLLVAHLWQVQASGHLQGKVRGPLLLEEVLDWFQSSQEQDHTAEVCSLFVVALVLGYRQVAEELGLASGQLRGMCSGENPGCSACQALEQEAEDHHNGQALEPLVSHSEAVHQIPAEVEVHRSGEEVCTGSQGHHHMANGYCSPGSWQ